MNNQTKNPSPVVSLFDVDNTLLDNDRIIEELRTHLRQKCGLKQEEEYWAIFDQLREELGYADYLGALQRYRQRYPRDPHLLVVSYFLLEYPFADRLFPKVLEVLQHAKQWGPVVILSDGDVIFQPRKVERSGLSRAVDGNVLIYVHKEQQLEDVEERYPARHYILVDDKLRILAAVKNSWGARVTTVFPRQGHYAHDPRILASYPPAEVTLEKIADLLDYDMPRLVAQTQPHT